MMATTIPRKKPSRRAKAGGLLLPLLASVALWALAACSLPWQRAGHEAPPPLLWPQPPEQPRIAWVESVGPADLIPAQDGLWAKLAAVFTGSERPRILRPYGVYASRGQLFIADPGGGTVHIVDPERRRHRFLQTPEQASFGSPIAITGDGRDTVFFTDSLAGRVYRYDLAREELAVLNASPLGRPTGIAFSRKEDLIYVADTLEHAVVALDREGRERFRFGSRGAGRGEFSFPTDLFVDRQGRVWVTDAMNFRLQAFSADGTFLSAFGEAGNTSGRLAKPKGVAVDGDGHIYVCDALFDTVQIFDESGQLLLWFGEKGTERGEFWMPSGIFIDEENTVFVTDTYNRRIQVFRYLPSGTQP